MINQNISIILSSLKKAQQNLQEIRSKFSYNKFLLDVYEPSALEAVKFYKERLQMAISEETNLDVSINDDNDTDFWIHIEGKNFKNGQGSITFIGNYFNKFNTTCKNILRLIGKTETFEKEESLFYLSGTAVGSLKLGIRENLFEDFTFYPQENLFETDENENWNEIKRFSKKKHSIDEALELLLKTMESSNSDEALNQLRDEINDNNKFIKLLNYARELTPSSKSNIDFISFEGNRFENNVKVSKETRNKINNYTKTILQDKKFVSGTALIRAQDMDSKEITARPFYCNDSVIDILNCVLPDENSEHNYLNKFVNITGFLNYDKNNKPQKLEIDNITIQSQNED